MYKHSHWRLLWSLKIKTWLWKGCSELLRHQNTSKVRRRKWGTCSHSGAYHCSLLTQSWENIRAPFVLGPASHTLLNPPEHGHKEQESPHSKMQSAPKETQAWADRLGDRSEKPIPVRPWPQTRKAMHPSWMPRDSAMTKKVMGGSGSFSLQGIFWACRSLELLMELVYFYKTCVSTVLSLLSLCKVLASWSLVPQVFCILCWFHTGGYSPV